MNEREYLEEKLKYLSNVKVISDTGWSDAIKAGRCIKDFNREVKFYRKLEPNEVEEIQQIMHEDEKCPGWTGVRGYLVDEESFLYRFSTTWDSSD